MVDAWGSEYESRRHVACFVAKWIKRVYLPHLINYMMAQPKRDSRVANASD